MITENANGSGLLEADSILLDVELMVARRADELSAASPHGHDFDREYWTRAEQEILAVHSDDHSD